MNTWIRRRARYTPCSLRAVHVCDARAHSRSHCPCAAVDEQQFHTYNVDSLQRVVSLRSIGVEWNARREAGTHSHGHSNPLQLPLLLSHDDKTRAKAVRRLERPSDGSATHCAELESTSCSQVPGRVGLAASSMLLQLPRQSDLKHTCTDTCVQVRRAILNCAGVLAGTALHLEIRGRSSRSDMSESECIPI